MRTRLLILLLTLTLLAAGCAQGQSTIAPPEIRFGEDVCAECKMIISDPRFAAASTYEVSPGRYESVLFDDIGDMLIYADNNPDQTAAANWVHDYNSKEWLDSAKAAYVVSDHLETPMGHGVAAFADQAAAQQLAAELGGEVLDWNALHERHHEGGAMTGADHEMEVGDHGDAPMTEAGDAMEAGDHGHAADQPASSTAGKPAPQGREFEGEIEGYHVHVISKADALHAGYNPVWVHLTGADGLPVDGAEATMTPRMNMVDGGHHGSGVEQLTEAGPGMFEGALIFSMPGGPDLGSWEVAVAFTDTVKGTSNTALVPVDVAPSKLHGSFMGPDETKIFLSLVQPVQPAVGSQPFEVYAMQKRGMEDWPALDDLTLEITPRMTTMDHGSPGNENPVAQGGGRYLGAVNFSMAGPWAVTVVAKEGETVLGEVVFEFQVP